MSSPYLLVQKDLIKGDSCKEDLHGKKEKFFITPIQHVSCKVRSTGGIGPNTL